MGRQIQRSHIHEPSQNHSTDTKRSALGSGRAERETHVRANVAKDVSELDAAFDPQMKGIHMTKKEPKPRDPTPEEIWGPGGLAEQERAKRKDRPDACNHGNCRLIMLPRGFGKLLGIE